MTTNTNDSENTMTNTSTPINEIAESVYVKVPCKDQQEVDARLGDFLRALTAAGYSVVPGTVTFDPTTIVRVEGWTFCLDPK